MHNFVLENPTKIIFGKNTIEQLGNEVKSLGKKALLVFGRQSIKQNGIYQQVIASLNKHDISVFEHSGVTSNPEVKNVRLGIEISKSNKIDVLIAVGGGSVMDSAKAIAAGAVVDHDVWKFFKAKKGITTPLPICCIPTLAASGSEMNGGMVLSNNDLGLKIGIGNKKLCPKVSILDPETTFSVPPDYTAYGAVDAMSHILEFYFTCEDGFSPVQDRFMEGLLINIMESCDAALVNPQDYKARANLMWCSAMALNGWTSAGLGRVGFPMHMIEHSISALYDVPHGAGLSVILPAWLKWRAETYPDKICQFSHRVFGLPEGKSWDQAMNGIKQLELWFARIKTPTRLSELSICEDNISDIAENSLIQAKIWRLRDYNKKIIEKILHLAL